MASSCVLDASAALRLITHDPGSERFALALGQTTLVLAPELMLTEVANALWKLQRAGSLRDIDPQLLLADSRDLVDQIEPDRELQVEVWLWPVTSIIRLMTVFTWPWRAAKEQSCSVLINVC